MQDAWVKGGYIQFDKLLFLHSQVIDNVMKRVTAVKLGQFSTWIMATSTTAESDGGDAIHDPLVRENYIMDEFATTELGAEFY